MVLHCTISGSRDIRRFWNDAHAIAEIKSPRLFGDVAGRKMVVEKRRVIVVAIFSYHNAGRIFEKLIDHYAVKTGQFAECHDSFLKSVLTSGAASN